MKNIVSPIFTAKLSTADLKDIRKAIDEELKGRKEKDWAELHKAYDTIINAVRDNPSECFDNIGAIRYLKDMATVKIDPTRQRGKTHYILERFDPKQDMIIVANVSMKKQMIEKCHERFPTMLPYELPIDTIGGLEFPRFYTRNIKPVRIVWIDESKLISDRDLYSLYSILANSPNAEKITIVCMG